MKLQSLLVLALSAALAPQTTTAFPTSLSIRDTITSSDLALRDFFSSDLEKRRGGGGRGSSGSSSGSSSSGSSSSSGKSGSSSSSSSSSSGKSGSTSSTSSTGGTSSKGSGTTRSYGSGSYYAGGASVPYRAGSTSTRGVAPFLLVPAAVAFWPHPWGYPVYAYPWAHPYYYHGNGSQHNGTWLNNGTLTNGTSGNWSMPVTCLCQQYNTCGCDDDPSNSTYISSILGNGTSAPSNISDVLTVAEVNGTTTAYINGTLANGTTASGAGVALMYSQSLSMVGYWVLAMSVGGATFLI